MAILLVAGLTGCATQPRISQETWDFRVAGKLAVRDAEAGHSARFAWRQLGREYDIEVWGPLGQGRTRLAGTPERMTVRRGAEVLDRGHPDDVMRRHLGWAVPVDALPAWLRGVAYAALPQTGVREDELGRVTGFRQAGWSIDFDRFKAFAGQEQPGRITAVRGDYRVRVVIGEYEVSRSGS